jgi:hypothetical protein
MPSPIRYKPMLVALTMAAAWLLLLPGCNTEPINSDGCRAIETARCQAAKSCPAMSITDVDACERFYRDQCLHGLASASDPGQPSIDQCVRNVNIAGKCASQKAPSCALEVSGDSDPCDFVAHPENYKECSFLVPPAVEVADAASEDDSGEAATDAASAE